MLKLTRLHPWEVSPPEAIKIQKSLQGKISSNFPLEIKKIKRVAGADVTYLKESRGLAVVVVLSFPSLRLLEVSWEKGGISFPYIPGLLTFREGPLLLKALEKLKKDPEVIFFDGQGICHPRRMGVATHLGLWLEIPTLGCAKSILTGSFLLPGEEKGAYSFIKEGGETIGVALRTRRKVKPVFVSPGHKIDLNSCIHLTLGCSPHFRIPEPLRKAHRIGKLLKREINLLL